ncbi:hypothetical protein EVAR_29599_1 [Eumeta japonica]|uniref:Uncharacterized protein n=1 Tax=Eumeta variegata TaxID=151549 RepID=A0A4C1VVC1_EUMVA|nr:hypothetical protein EVAR_29599_1 [Eumeta japonica]
MLSLFDGRTVTITERLARPRAGRRGFGGRRAAAEASRCRERLFLAALGKVRLDVTRLRAPSIYSLLRESGDVLCIHKQCTIVTGVAAARSSCAGLRYYAAGLTAVVRTINTCMERERRIREIRIERVKGGKRSGFFGGGGGRS